MKTMKIMLMVMAIAGLTLDASANEPKKVNSKIDRVTVFLQGAQVVRSAPVSLQPGTTDIIFEGVSPNLNTGSLQAGGRGSFVVMGVRYNTEYTPPGTKRENAVPASLLKKIEMTQDSLSQMDFETETLNYRLQAWNTEKNMLERNKLITGEGKTDSLALFIQAMEYYRKKIHEINEKIVQTKMEQRALNRRRSEITVRLNELLNYKGQLEQENVTQASYSYQVIVTVSAKAATSGSITINYLVNNASWSPFYELRAENSSQPVSMHYKAYISQNTGEDWKDVKLTLSTMSPQRQHTKPTLAPWIIKYIQPQANYGYVRSNAAIPLSQGAVVTDSYKEAESVSTKAMKAPAQSLSVYTQQSINFSNVEFDIELPYSIPADGKSVQVTVMEEKIDAQFKHYTVPKIEQEAFLMGRLTGWEKLNLLPGNANIYFLNTIIGSTQINPNTINDTLNVPLGRDPGVSVTRKKLKDKESTKVLSNTIEKEIVIEISIRNKKDEKVEIRIEDQLPVSGEQDVKIKYSAQTLSGAEVNEQTGELNWNIKLNPRETKTFVFSYIISYPKDKNLQI
jgi:uncharacterized protein (TIGR02231 family)